MGLGWEPRAAHRLRPTQETGFLSEAVGALQSSELQGSLSEARVLTPLGNLQRGGPGGEPQPQPQRYAGRGIGRNCAFPQSTQRSALWPLTEQVLSQERPKAGDSLPHPGRWTLAGIGREALIGLSCGGQAWGAGSRGVSVLVIRGVAMVMG